MKLQVFAVRDRAADVYDRPFFAVSIGTAIRSFTDECNRPESNIARHPEDFDLYHLGSFNDADGLFDTGVPHMVAVGKDCAKPKS